MLFAITSAILGVIIGIGGFLSLSQPNHLPLTILSLPVAAACFYPWFRESQKANAQNEALLAEQNEIVLEKAIASVTEADLMRNPGGLRACLKCHDVGRFQIESRAYGCSVFLLTMLLPLVGYLIYRVADKATRNYKCFHCGSWESIPVNTPTGQAIYFALPEVRRKEVLVAMAKHVPGTKPDLKTVS